MFSVSLATFGIIFLAELGDKTQLTAMALSTKFSGRKIFLGIAAAFFVLNLAAVVVGKILFVLIPVMWIGVISGALFLFFGVTTLLAKDEEEDDGKAALRKAAGPVLTAFLLILMAELGDKTQIVTSSLSAQYNAPVAVFIGSTLALWIVSLLGILLGKQLTRYIPLSYIHRIAGAVFLIFGVATIIKVLW